MPPRRGHDANSRLSGQDAGGGRMRKARNVLNSVAQKERPFRYGGIPEHKVLSMAQSSTA